MLKSLEIYCTSLIIFSASVGLRSRSPTGALPLGPAVELPSLDPLLYKVAQYSQRVRASDADQS